ncbi:hypothetical protein TL16_g08324 [Triparma laevis f. inornata]|uniref:Kinesin light chain n=2 Tax=Triparma laevis TaxID=1534972 RepID=A0A9W7CIJ6_9STRA|nr:hypothetical protein TL16_g08324 [Triparma laevis f. inornata]GMI06463.1 hypothetical protein TrLO_g11800 [Triparma laevis f. longispina]
MCCWMLGENSEKALEATYGLIASEEMSEETRVEEFRDLVKRANESLGEDNPVTLDALNDLGEALNDTGQFEEAQKILEESFAATERMLGPDHWKTLSMNNLGNVFLESRKGEKALEIYLQCLKRKETTLGKTHPATLETVANIAMSYDDGLKQYDKAMEYYARAMKGWEMIFGKDHSDTRGCARNYRDCLNKRAEEMVKYAEEIEGGFPGLDEDSDDVVESEEEIGQLAAIRQSCARLAAIRQHG